MTIYEFEPRQSTKNPGAVLLGPSREEMTLAQRIERLLLISLSEIDPKDCVRSILQRRFFEFFNLANPGLPAGPIEPKTLAAATREFVAWCGDDVQPLDAGVFVTIEGEGSAMHATWRSSDEATGEVIYVTLKALADQAEFDPTGVTGSYDAAFVRQAGSHSNTSEVFVDRDPVAVAPIQGRSIQFVANKFLDEGLDSLTDGQLHELLFYGELLIEMGFFSKEDLIWILMQTGARSFTAYTARGEYCRRGFAFQDSTFMHFLYPKSTFEEMRALPEGAGEGYFVVYDTTKDALEEKFEQPSQKTPVAIFRAIQAGTQSGTPPDAHGA